MKGLTKMPAALTIESSYAAMDPDMGNSHIIAHSNQRKYLMKNEDPIDYLMPNNEKLTTVQQAIRSGVEAGQLRSVTEWKKYNSNLRKDRRLNSYDEYVKNICSNASQKIYRNLDKALQNPKTPKAKKSLIATEYASLASHDDMPIIGTLLYFGDAEELEQAKKDGYFEQLKSADKEAGNLFVQSKEFKCLHPQAFKIERHNDEMGRPHLQTMESCFTTRTRDYKTKKGTVRKRIDGCGRTQYQLNGLINYFGSKEAVNNQLDRLIELQQNTQDKIKKNGGNRVGLVRPEADILLDDFDQQEAKKASDKLTKDIKPKTVERLRRQTIAQLVRVVDFSAMSKAKAEAYEMYNLPAKYSKTDVTYNTDGKHLTAHQYRLKMAAKDEGQVAINQAKTKAKQIKKAAKSDATNIVKIAHKKAKKLVDEAKTKQTEIEQAKNEALYDKAKVDHQVHLAEMRLAELNQQANDADNQLKHTKQEQEQRQTALKKDQEKHHLLMAQNNQLSDEINHNTNIIRSITGLKKQAKEVGLSVNEVVSDRSKLINKIRLIGKAYAVLEKTTKLAIALMTGKQIVYKENKAKQEYPSERAFAAGITLENYKNAYTTDKEKKSMERLPIVLANKTNTWLEKKFKEKFGMSPFKNKPSKKINPQISQQDSEEHIPE